MNASILATGIATPADVPALRDDPLFRKATVPMILAHQALTRAVAGLTDEARALLPEAALIIGINYAELAVTREFLTTLAVRGMARPFLFQSSLHNAALGFLSTHWGCLGPGFTTTTHYFAGEDALALAQDLLQASACPLALVIGVEAADDLMAPVCTTTGSGAGAAIMGPVTSTTRWQLGPIACHRAPHAVAAQTMSSFYGADAVEHLHQAVANGHVGALSLPKPDGAKSVLTIARRGP